MVAIDMEMPKSCYDCYRKKHCEVGIDGGWRTDIRVEGCPLVEIGTCKKCRHWDKSEEHCLRLSSDNGWFEDEYYRVYTESDFYCKYFEKRDDEKHKTYIDCQKCENFRNPDYSKCMECEKRGNENENYII